MFAIDFIYWLSIFFFFTTPSKSEQLFPSARLNQCRPEELALGTGGRMAVVAAVAVVVGDGAGGLLSASAELSGTNLCFKYDDLLRIWSGRLAPAISG